MLKEQCSVTELSESSSDGTLSIGRVSEGGVVAGTPRELRAEASEDTLFVIALRGDVADFLLSKLEILHAWVQLGEFHLGESRDIANVAHRLQLVQMLRVVNEVEHEVVLHGDVKSLHLLSLSATSSADSAFHGVLGLHESLVLGLDLVDDTWGVDGVTVTIPIDVLEFSGALVLVVVIEESLQLTMGVAGALRSGSSTKSLQPDSGQVTACAKQFNVSQTRLRCV